MADERVAADIDATIDSRKLSRYQWLVICLCAATVIFDGFDNQTIGLLAPSIAKNLHLDVAHLGVVFSSGLFGWMIGSLAMGPIADRFGRRWTIVTSVLAFGIFTLIATTARSLDELVVLWFLNGLGLGGAVPNALALATEFAPRRLEEKVACWVITGMPVGAILGGITSTALLPLGGWRAVLYVGSALPLILAALLMVWLPESARFMIAVKASQERVKRVMQRIVPDLNMATISYFYSRQEAAKGVPVRELFREGRGTDTVLFWVAFFGNLMILYFVLNWFPAMLHGAGLPLSTAIIAITIYSVGGAVGTSSMGYVMAAAGARRATITQLVLSAVIIAILANSHSVAWIIWGLAAILGIAVQGAQAGLNALAAGYYPTSMRSTGLGWALGMGRIGSIVGPLLGELVLLLHWSIRGIFMFGMIPALLAAVALSAITLRHRRRAVMELART